MSYNSKYTGKQVEEILESVGGKQDRITDLTAIREGASKGATAIQNIKTLNNQSLLGSGNIDITNSYITDFNVEILFGAIDNALANPGQHYSINSSADLLSAISAGKTIFIPYEQIGSGYICAINALNDGDTFYLTIAKENSLITLELDNEDLSHGTIYISDSVIYITKTSYVVTSFTMEDLYAMADVPSGSIPFTDIVSVQNAFSARRPVYVRASENEKLSMYPLTGHRDEDQWYFYVWRGDTLVTMESYDDANLEYITNRHVPSEFKTINGESIIGEGDITIVGGGGDEPYITTCTVGDLRNLAYGIVDRIEFDPRGIAGALSENKRVLMPYDTTSSHGYYSVVGRSQGDILYLTVVSNAEAFDIQTSLNYPDLDAGNITRLVIPSENQLGNAAIHQLAFDFPVVYDVFEEGQYEVNSEDYGTFFDTADVGIIVEKIRTEGNVVVAVVDDHDGYQLLPATVWFDEQAAEFNILVYSPYSKYWYEILMNFQSGYQSIKRYKNGETRGEVYLTPFTVEQFCTGNVELTDEQRNELLNAASQNRIIGMPYNGVQTGYVIADYSYEYSLDDGLWSLDLGVIYNGAHYTNFIGSSTDIIFSASRIAITPFKPLVYTVAVEDGHANVSDDLSYPDNCVFRIDGECSEVFVHLEPSEIGKTVKFLTGESCTLEIAHPVYWANGEMPTIEPYTNYELSLVANMEGAFNGVLTAFKPVE